MTTYRYTETMPAPIPDLSDIAIVIETPDVRIVTNFDLFPSIDAACHHLEHWWVEQGEGFVFTATGERLTLGVDAAQRVTPLHREALADGPATVLAWLRASAAQVREARRSRARRRGGDVAAEDDALPDNVVDLIAYIGFSR